MQVCNILLIVDKNISDFSFDKKRVIKTADILF